MFKVNVNIEKTFKSVEVAAVMLDTKKAVQLYYSNVVNFDKVSNDIRYEHYSNFEKVTQSWVDAANEYLDAQEEITTETVHAIHKKWPAVLLYDSAMKAL